ncbi:5'/3'-nucleotidase SurE [Marinobacterium aestuariivivens]|uniref:5'-nucleotidase n=1 Tax=Marinobacterium aestuariivivens TaxID=1698799 RepID=A0ABW2A3J4_9GAMM
MRFNRLAVCVTAGAALLPLPSLAMNVLLVNDDGLTANVQALRTALLAAGHEVLLSVPCRNQSGKGASLDFFKPIGPLTETCVGEAATVGDPGVGPIDGLDDAHYVDGTPVMATMYGLDVLAPQHWGMAPDLVLSGPNEGQNLGTIALTSGTVSNSQYALSRGVSAISVSADHHTSKDASFAPEVADLTLQLLAQLEARSLDDELLPDGVALNVNIPDFHLGESTLLPWEVTRFGNFEQMNTFFVTSLGDDPLAARLGLAGVDLPGVTFAFSSPDDATADTDPQSEALKLLEGAITVTPMQLGYEASLEESHRLSQYLRQAMQ